MAGRESNRIKATEKTRVLDEVARQRRARKALEALEQDNFHEDPHADLVMSKKVPKFQDNQVKNSKDKKLKRKTIEYNRGKFKKTLSQLLEEERQLNRPASYFRAQVPPPKKPARHFCAVCGSFSSYTCTACGTRFCCVRCLHTHKDTRCLKWTA